MTDKPPTYPHLIALEDGWVPETGGYFEAAQEAISLAYGILTPEESRRVRDEIAAADSEESGE